MCYVSQREGNLAMMERLGRLALAGALAITLGSCAQSPARMTAQPQAKIVVADGDADAQCRSYGATPGTPTYKECRANVEAAMKRGMGYTSDMFVGDPRWEGKQ
jgi:hypothetical protein